MGDDILTLAEAAALVRMHPDTLRKSDAPRIQRGERGRLKFERAALLAWLRGERAPLRRVA
jgi:hypothetical protein